ncbi:hypothetical protein J113_20885 [Mycobacterium tuberculosis CAS/NITR204]|uniref:Uncharacterized protein n=1 Tax=Mycobacterium tuberculosis CAS/NITR204 TaxID=1310114 RepID=R4MHR6_MYCTX|nr:hypothetical protein J113_20885 [Mycobacterium tuberculosis CAS/NITR204]
MPSGSTLDATETVTSVLERFAPGFRDIVVAARAVPASDDANANYVGSITAAPTHLARDRRPHPAVESLAHTDSQGVPVFCGDSARRRRARHVRLVCRSNAVAHRVRHHPHAPFGP